MMKEIMKPKFIWKGERIQCLKSARTANCKICMVERKEILHRFRTDRKKIINDNSDIYSSCKCGTRFHKFARNLKIETLRTRRAQKKVTSTRNSKQKRRTTRFSFDLESTDICQPCNDEPSVVTPEPASPPATPVFYDTNIPGILPYRSPTTNPTNLELAQLRAHRKILDREPIFEV